MSDKKYILVTGATGKQGRGTIEALQSLSSSMEPFEILALARDPSSRSAQALSKFPNVTVIQGDLNDCKAIFAGRNIWGVHSIQINSDAEEAQGKGMVDAAAAAGVRHFVYSSGDRGGPERSDVDPTNVKNFAAKFAIEKHLEAAAAASKERGEGKQMTYTILRPVTFYENQSHDRHGLGFGRMWMQIGGGDQKLQIISTRDIGWFAAQAFAHHQDPQYLNKALSLAGDELTAKEAQKIFEEETGKVFPMAPCLIGSALKTFLRETVGDMFAWFEKEGYGASVDECRKANSQMLDYRTWVREYSGFAKK